MRLMFAKMMPWTAVKRAIQTYGKTLPYHAEYSNRVSHLTERMPLH